ncbi:MAG: M20/M25/M40 family metallo-hydrolase [Halieaceae bacterium]|jgi:acetylornithine deacetylase/succinyl-diaminopimelate desuccinylase-like protein|nr:M20/M25/M40 family metallo-hydrolase [Halieaceae bacterium]
MYPPLPTAGRALRALSASLLLAVPPAFAQSPADEAVAWLQEFLRIDTINPPGNESRAVDFYSRILDAEGIEWTAAESAPGRGNIWARLEGGDEPALILLQHTDVVPADMKYWTTDPLSGDRRDGYIWGRGALDMKSTGISQLSTFLSLHRSGRPLNRDVVFVATADEEAGGLFGAGWLLENHPEIFEGAGLLLNEGGSGEISPNGDTVFSVEVTQKVPVWLRMTAVDTPGHGSMPNASSAVTRIVQAMELLRTNPFPARIIGPVDAMFRGLAPSADGEWSEAYADIASAIEEPGFLERLQRHSAPMHALTRDTCSMTRMSGSNKINVVPPEAWAEVDCRILPDKPVEDFIAEFRELVAPSGVEVEVIMAFSPAVTETGTRLYSAIERITAERHPGSRVMPSVSTGFTDSHFTRDAGIASYGFDAVIVPEVDAVRIHGNDERINEAAFRRGIDDYRAIVEAVVYD